MLKAMNGIALLFSGKKEEAMEILNNYLKEYEKGKMRRDVKVIISQMEGNFDKEANVKFELEGYEHARSIFLDGIDFPNITYFLIQKNGKWVGNFQLYADEWHYIFVVDGKRVLDPKNSDVVIDQGLEYNRIFVKE